MEISKKEEKKEEQKDNNRKSRSFRNILFSEENTAKKPDPLSDTFGHKNAKGKTVLHKAAKHNKFKIIEEINTVGSYDLNTLDDSGLSALHIAAMNNSLESLRLLIKFANVNLQDKIGETALHKAVAFNQAENVEELVQKCNTELTTNKIANATSLKSIMTSSTGLNTALHYAFTATDINAKIVNILLGANKTLVNRENQRGETPFFLALTNSHIKQLPDNVFAEILSHANITVKTLNNETYLHAATKNPQLPSSFFEALVKSFAAIKSRFEASLPWLNEVDNNGNTALFYLIKNNQKDHIIKLLEFNPNPNIWRGEAPLHVAIQSNMTEVAIKLLDLGADPNAEDKYGNTPLIYAAKEGNVAVIEALKAKKADFSKKQDLIIKKALLNNHIQALIKLIDFGASPKVSVHPRAIDHRSSKRFSIGSLSSNDESYSENDGQDKTKLLEPGDNPLHYAVKAENAELVLACLKKDKTLVNEANDKGKSPAHAAIRQLVPEIAHLMYKHGDKIKFSLPCPGKSSGGLFSSDVRHNTLLMDAMGRGFETPKQLTDFFEDSDYQLNDAQVKKRKEILTKRAPSEREQLIESKLTFNSRSSSGVKSQAESNVVANPQKQEDGKSFGMN